MHLHVQGQHSESQSEDTSKLIRRFLLLLRNAADADAGGTETRGRRFVSVVGDGDDVAGAVADVFLAVARCLA